MVDNNVVIKNAQTVRVILFPNILNLQTDTTDQKKKRIPSAGFYFFVRLSHIYYMTSDLYIFKRLRFDLLHAT